MLPGDGSGDDLRVQPDQWRPDRGHSSYRGGVALHPPPGHDAQPDGRSFPAPTPHAGQGPQGKMDDHFLHPLLMVNRDLKVRGMANSCIHSSCWTGISRHCGRPLPAATAHVGQGLQGKRDDHFLHPLLMPETGTSR